MPPCTSILMAVSQAILGLTLNSTALYATSNSTWIDVSEYLLPACIIVCALGYGLGLGPVLFSLLGEIISPKIKSVACAMIMSLR